MSRTPAWLTARSTLTGGIMLLIVLSFLPARWTSFLSVFHTPMLTLLAPISAPIRGTIARLRGPDGPRELDNPLIADLTRRNDELLRDFAQARLQVSDLQRQIRELNLGRELNANIQVRQIVSSVIGYGGDLGGLISVKAGRRDGIDESTVAVIRGVQLVGRVRRLDDRTAAIQLLTDRGTQPLTGVVMLDDRAFGPQCLLEPDSKGLLFGPLQEDQDDPNKPATIIAPGMTVRLSDPSWPAAAQMLVLGKIDRLERSAKQSLRRVVFIRPESSIERVSEVILRTGDIQGAAPTSGGRP